MPDTKLHLRLSIGRPEKNHYDKNYHAEICISLCSSDEKGFFDSLSSLHYGTTANGSTHCKFYENLQSYLTISSSGLSSDRPFYYAEAGRSSIGLVQSESMYKTLKSVQSKILKLDTEVYQNELANTVFKLVKVFKVSGILVDDHFGDKVRELDGVTFDSLNALQDEVMAECLLFEQEDAMQDAIA